MSSNKNKRASTLLNNSNQHQLLPELQINKKSDDGSSQEEDLSDHSKWNHHPAGAAAALRFSARVVEKQEKLLQKQSPNCGISKGSSVATTANNPPDPDPLIPRDNDLPVNRNSKKKRNWTLWSSDDKQYFFEGLNEYGKDFEAIQNYISSKLKSKRGSLMTKNKDQVRHFYYRTWNKISKFLSFPEMKKAHQELYGLINYGELRKKQRVLNLKTAVKLSELVQKGSTTIKVRGKTFRIKTPLCRALKKLNRLEEPESKLPNKVMVELVPENGDAWTQVQNLSFNPRVRVTVSLQRSLASLIHFFENRWKGTEVKMKEQLLQTFGKPIPRLRFLPQGSTSHHSPTFKVLEATTCLKMSLKNYACLLKRDKKVGHDSGGDEHENEQDTEDEKISSEQAAHSASGVEGIVDDDWLGRMNCASDWVKGWTEEEAGMVTIGELYLRIGHGSTLLFNYKWDSPPEGKRNLLAKLITISSLLKKKRSSGGKGKGTYPCPHCPRNTLPNTSTSTQVRNHPLSLRPDPSNPPLPSLQLQQEPVRQTEGVTEKKSIILLPKGNRRLGRPANRKVIVPRVLPLRPKIQTQLLTITNIQDGGFCSALSGSTVVDSASVPSLITPSEFNELLEVGKETALNENSTFSLSSFLDMTLPQTSCESNQGANDSSRTPLPTDKFLSSEENSLLNLLDCKESCMLEKKGGGCGEDGLLSNGPWLHLESNDLSLSSLLGNLEGHSGGFPVENQESSRDDGTQYLDQ